MKRSAVPLLLFLMALPLVTVFAFDYRYDVVERGICSQFVEFRDFCSYAERHERDRVLRTNFYRHLGSMTGRSEGTSLSIDKDIEYTLLAARQTSTEEVIDKTRFAAEEAEYRLQRFNFTFFAAMLVSTAVAGGAAALLTQRLYHARRKQGGSD